MVARELVFRNRLGPPGQKEVIFGQGDTERDGLVVCNILLIARNVHLQRRVT